MCLLLSRAAHWQTWVSSMSRILKKETLWAVLLYSLESYFVPATWAPEGRELPFVAVGALLGLFGGASGFYYWEMSKQPVRARWLLTAGSLTLGVILLVAYELTLDRFNTDLLFYEGIQFVLFIFTYFFLTFGIAFIYRVLWRKFIAGQ